MDDPVTGAPAPRLMLLSLWRHAAGGWHARVVGLSDIGLDAVVREFDSPFELVRFLAERPEPPAQPSMGSGLR